VIVVGGGNSAGQAAVFLAQTTKRVHVLVRSEGLATSMSRYLIRRIEENPTISLHTRTGVSGSSDGRLRGACAGDVPQSGQRRGSPPDRSVSFVLNAGRRARACAERRGDWWRIDPEEFIRTGRALSARRPWSVRVGPRPPSPSARNNPPRLCSPGLATACTAATSSVSPRQSRRIEWPLRSVMVLIRSCCVNERRNGDITTPFLANPVTDRRPDSPGTGFPPVTPGFESETGDKFTRGARIPQECSNEVIGP
jgi:hypothetical protein